MRTEIVVALIGATAVVVGAIIAAVATIISASRKTKKSGDSESNTVTGNKNITFVGNENKISINEENEEPKKSILSFVTSNVDPEYVLNVTGTEKKVYDEGFAMINVRIINKGNLDAAVTKLKIIAKDYVINTEPHFCFFMYVEEGDLFVDVLNNGWGTAESYLFNISLFDNNDSDKLPITYINHPKYFSKAVNKIHSNERVNLFRIRSSYFNENILKTNVYKKETNTPFKKMLVKQCAIDISAVVTYEKNGYKAGNTSVRIEPNCFGFSSNILLSSERFSLYKSPVQYCLGKPDTIYATIIDETTSTKEYNISRIINSGGIDDFNIYVGSDKSCNFNIILSFCYNNEAIITSNEIPISINRYTNSQTCNHYVDGCEIALENFRKKNQLQHIW